MREVLINIGCIVFIQKEKLGNTDGTVGNISQGVKYSRILITLCLTRRIECLYFMVRVSEE